MNITNNNLFQTETNYYMIKHNTSTYNINHEEKKYTKWLQKKLNMKAMAIWICQLQALEQKYHVINKA